MSIWGTPVMMGGSGGGGGSTNVLSGKTTPTAAQGNNGAMYLKYSTLPSGYSSVEYIEASGSQYIDTGVIGTGATEIEFDISIVSSVSAWRVLMGAYTANVKNSFGVLLNGLTTISYQRGNNVYQDQSYSITIGNRYVFRTDKEKLYINDVNTHTLSGYAVTTPVNLYLSAVNANGTASDFAPPHKLYGAKIWEAGDLIRWFTPCVRTADNIPGLYDMVNGQFYHSGGSDEYSAGSPATAETPIVASYAKVSGAWQALIGTDINDIDLGGGGGTEDVSIYGSLFKYCLLSTDSTDKFNRDNRWFRRSTNEPIIVLGGAFFSSGAMSYTGYVVISFTGTAVKGGYSSYGGLSTPPRTATTPSGTTFYIQHMVGFFPPSSAYNKLKLEFGTNSNDAQNVLEFVIDDTKLIYNADTSTFEGDSDLLQAFYKFIDSVYQKYYA